VNESESKSNKSATTTPLLIGRDEELQALRESFKKVIKRGSTVVTIHGKAGTGKSTLVHAAQKQGAFRMDHIQGEFVSARFDATRSKSEPFSALASALTSLVQRLHELDNCSEKLNQFLVSIKEDTSMLRPVVPALFELAQSGKNSSTTTTANVENNCTTNSSKEKESERHDHHDYHHDHDAKSKFPTRERMLRRSQVLSVPNLNANLDAPDMIDHKISAQRLKVVIQKLLAFCSSSSRPCVVHLDDVQNMDQASWDFILSLLENCPESFGKNATTSRRKSKDLIPINGLLLILTLRNDYDKNGDMFNSNTLALREITMQLNAPSLEVSNLSEAHVNHFFAALVKAKPSTTTEMGKVIFGKTAGNPFHISQYLQLLQEDGHLFFDSVYDGRWKWTSPAEIESSTPIISDEVADRLAATRFSKVSKETQLLLVVASCMGIQVPLFVLKEFFSTKNGGKLKAIIGERKVGAHSEIEHHLQDAVDCGILRKPAESQRKLSCLSTVNSKSMPSFNSNSTNRTLFYTWSHENLQKAAYGNLLPTINRQEVHIRLGRLLHRLSDESSNSEWMVYLAASQFNSVESSSTSVRLHQALVELNLRAAKLSISKSAFLPAIDFLRIGIAHLPHANSDFWNDAMYYNLAIDLYSTLAEMHYYVGHFEESQDAINVVIQRGRSRDDTYRVESLKAEASTTGKNRDYNECQQCYISILAKYDIHVPRQIGSLTKVQQRIRLQSKFPHKRWQSIAHVHNMMEDPLAYKQCTVLSRLVFVCLAAKNWQLAKICCSHILVLSFKHGICEFTVLAVMFPAIRLWSKKKYKEVKERSGMAILLSNRLEPTGELFRIIAMMHGAVLHWSHSFHESLDPLSQGYSALLSIGDMEKAFITAMVYSFCYVNLGLNLGPLDSDLSNYHHASIQFNVVPSIRVMFPMMQQSLHNLQGNGYVATQHPTALNGDIMKEEDVLKELEGSSQYQSTLRDMCACRLMLSCVFNDKEAMQRNLDDSMDISFQEPMVSRVHFRSTYTGMAALLLGHDTSVQMPSSNRRSYLQLGRKMLEFFHDSVKNGSVNAYPVLVLLQAVDGRTEELYQRAITACGRSGLTHLEAIGNEQLALLLASGSLGNIDQEAIDELLLRASELYSEWGAEGKVARLNATNRSRVASSRERRTGQALKARRRYDGRSSAMIEKFTLGADMSNSLQESFGLTDEDDYSSENHSANK